MKRVGGRASGELFICQLKKNFLLPHVRPAVFCCLCHFIRHSRMVNYYFRSLDEEFFDDSKVTSCWLKDNFTDTL